MLNVRYMNVKVKLQQQLVRKRYKIIKYSYTQCKILNVSYMNVEIKPQQQLVRKRY